MKTRLQRWLGSSALRCTALVLAFALFLVALPAGADTSFTTTNWVAGVPVPGIQGTNGVGQVYLKGNVHVHRVVSTDARIAGRLQAWMDLGYQADGSAILAGPAYVEPGTWDPAGTNFTPSGGVWDLKYTGVAQADGSDVVNLTGYGIGGTIEGLRMVCTATKEPGAPFDPAIPYMASGTIKPAPIIVTNTISLANATSWPNIYPPGCITINSSQLTIHASWPGIQTHYISDSSAWASPERGSSVTQGHTLETRVGLVRLNAAAASAILAIYHDGGIGYWLNKAGDYVALGKQTPSGITFLSCESATTGNTSRVLALAVTPSGQNVILTARVLDRDNNEAVVYETSVTDTPASDPSLTATQVQQITGWALDGLVNDPAGAPWTTFKSPWLGLFQYTDGTLPAAEVTYDNFQTRTYDIPPVGIHRAVQLTWPATGMNFGVETAPSVNGPWLPVPNSVPPGFQQMTAPQNGPLQFFRLQQAP